MNVMCLSLGFTDDELPFKVSNPPKLDGTAAPELRFDLSAPVSSDEVVGDILAATHLEGQEPGRPEDCDEEETGESLLQLDETVNPGQSNPPNQNAEEDDNNVTTEDIALAEFLEEIDLAGESPVATERKVSSLTTKTFKPETTMESFIRLTNQQQWLPFNHSKTKPKTAEDIEEQSFFESMQSKCNRTVAPSAHRGHDAFERAWNLEVAKRHLTAVEEGNNDTLFIKRKRAKQLQDHCDWLQEQLRQSTRAEEQQNPDSIMQQRNKGSPNISS